MALGSVRSAVLTSGAQVVKAKADLAGTIASEKGVESVSAKDRATALNAKTQWQRLDTFFSQGITSQQDYDSAKAALDAADAQVAADQYIDSANKVAALGKTPVSNLFGDADPIGQTIRIKNVPFTVVGVLTAKGQSSQGQDQDDVILLPISQRQEESDR